MTKVPKRDIYIYIYIYIFILPYPLLNQLNVSKRRSCIWDYVSEKINDDDVCGTMMPPDETHYLFLSSYHHNFSLHLCLWATPIYFSIFYCYSLPSFVLFTVDYTHIMMSSQKKIIRVWPLHTHTTYTNLHFSAL